MNKIAYKKEMFGEPTKLSCSLCGEDNRDNLFIEAIGISIGMSGEDYSFCKECSSSKDFLLKLLKKLGFENGMKLDNECIEYRYE